MKYWSLFILCTLFIIQNQVDAQTTHSDGTIVYLVRLPEEKDTDQIEENKRIRAAFKQEFTIGEYYFYKSKDSKKVLHSTAKNVFFDANFQKKKLPSSIFKLYVITFGAGTSENGFERYNYDGFKLHTIENNQLKPTGIYGGAPYENLGLGKHRDYKKGIQKLIRELFKKGKGIL